MTMTAKKPAALRYEYSPTELKILQILRRRKTTWISTSQIAEEIYAGRDMPFHARIYINGSMRNLQRKTQANKDVTIHVKRDGELTYRMES